MKKAKVSKVVALVSTLTVLSSLAGCASDEKSSSDAASSSTTTANSSSAVKEFSYPIDTDETLTVWSSIMTPQKSFTDYTLSPYHTGLAEKTGVDVKWVFPTTGTDVGQAFNLMISSGELPDVIIHYISNDADQYIDEKVIRDLTDILPTEAPNYSKYLQDNPYYDTAVKSDSGKYYGFGSFREAEWNAVYSGPVVRTDWLKACGLTAPVTIADWDKTIRAFKDKYDAKLAFALGRTNPGIAGAFGAYGSLASGNSFLLYVDDNKKIQFSMAQDEWKSYMTQMSLWYKDGLIDTDSLTLDDAGMRTKALNNNVGISMTSMGQMTNWIADATSSKTGAEWAGLAYPVVKAGDKVSAIQMEDTSRSVSGAVTTSCSDDKVNLAARWLDYAFSEEGIAYMNFGTEGETYTMVNGVPTYTDVILKAPEGTADALDKYTCAQWTNIGIQTTGLVKQKNNPISVKAVDTWLENQDYQPHILPTGVTRTTDESTEFSALYNSIGTYVQEMSLKFMTGEESLDKFDEYLATLDSMGLPRFLEIQQTAYDRYLKR